MMSMKRVFRALGISSALASQALAGGCRCCDEPRLSPPGAARSPGVFVRLSGEQPARAATSLAFVTGTNLPYEGAGPTIPDNLAEMFVVDFPLNETQLPIRQQFGYRYWSIIVPGSHVHRSGLPLPIREGTIEFGPADIADDSKERYVYDNSNHAVEGMPFSLEYLAADRILRLHGVLRLRARSGWIADSRDNLQRRGVLRYDKFNPELNEAEWHVQWPAAQSEAAKRDFDTVELEVRGDGDWEVPWEDHSPMAVRSLSGSRRELEVWYMVAMRYSPQGQSHEILWRVTRVAADGCEGKADMYLGGEGWLRSVRDLRRTPR